MSLGFEDRFKGYLDDVLKATTEPSKTYFFLNFVSGVFGGVNAGYAEKMVPKLEKYIRVKNGTVVVSGRVDVFLGNLIIEFESDLVQKLEEAEEQLKKYVAILWSEQKHRVEWLAIASDGVNFRVYRPRTPVALGMAVSSGDVVLEEVDRCNLKNMYEKQGAEFVYVWLDRYLLYRTLIPPTTEEFVDDFGLKSKAFGISKGVLDEAWSKVRETGVWTIYEEWAKYLEIVYGSKVESEDLFLRHTYLATLAKLMAFMFYSGSALPSPEEVEKIVSGDIFREWGIYGFLEEDFFSWILKEDIKEQGLRFILDLLGRLKRYDLTQLEEDVLKGLYQELVDPKERHDLGEYYTPDWLAESIVQHVMKDFPDASVLDPACGSGTFLVSTIGFKKAHLKSGKSQEKILTHILTNVVGIDVHPLAMITSKVNYLLALGDLIRKYRRGRITIPVYMGDSIRLPKEVETLEERVVAYVVKGPKSRHFFIPKVIAENAEAHDEVVQTLRDYVKSVKDVDLDTFSNFLDLRTRVLAGIVKKQPKTKKSIYRSLFRTAESMSDLQKEGKDTIWAFILKNLFKPLFFFVREKKFDIIMGNPPWLSYRYVRSTEYQDELKKLIVERYKLLPSEKAELMTHMELATLFLLRTTDLYLKSDGLLGFVMPRSVFSADQHDNFRRGSFIHPDLDFTDIFDLLDVSPLFNVPSCVFFVRKSKRVKYPVKAVVFSGNLAAKNCNLAKAEECFTKRKASLNLGAIGARSFLTEKVFEIPKRRSDYYKKVYQGATVVPRQFWFVDIVAHPKFGVNRESPYLRTSERAQRLAKKQYENLVLEGNIESQFLYGALTGSEIVPFGHLEPSLAILPIEPNANGYRLISLSEAETRGLLSLAEWLKKVDNEWVERRSEKAERMSGIDWLNYKNKLTRQNPKKKFKVLYNTSGTFLVSAVLRNQKTCIVINENKIDLNRIIIDHKLYYFETENEDEALYLSAMLNSSIIDDIIKPAQSRGAYGPRDIHKKPFEISIPKYDPKNNTHQQLSNLGKKCENEVKKLLPDLARRYDSIGVIRRKLNEALKVHIDQIDELVLKLFEQQGYKDTLEAFT